MNAAKIATELRRMARGVCDDGCFEPQPKPDDADVAELLRVLSRVVEGKPVDAAFGAPGDWGYGTPIGDALAER